MADGIPTDPPVKRKLDWGALARQAWGDEWHKHEKVYAFRRGRQFESSDYGTQGLYLPVTAIDYAGTAQDGTSRTITLGTDANGGPNDYVGKTITLTAGAGDGQSRSIVGYDPATKLAVIVPEWTGTLDYDPAFFLELADLGSGEVDTTALIGGVSATFTRATTATTVNSAGTIISVASGVPRSYYDPTTLEYLGYLAEGARTNLCLQSEDFTYGATWTQTSGSGTVDTDTTIAPDGTLTADTLNDVQAGALNGVRQTFVVADDSLTHTCTVFLQKTSGALNYKGLQLRYTGGATPLDARAVFNTNTGLFTANSGSPTLAVQEYQGYWRLFITLANNTSGNVSMDFSIDPAWNLNGTITVDAAATGSAVAWGAQVEKAAFASTYIPTTTVAVARNADVLTYPTTGWLSATAGTIYAEFAPLQITSTSAGRAVQISDGTNNERLSITTQNSSTNLQFFVTDGSVSQAGISVAAGSAAGVIQKTAAAYAANDFAFSANASAVGTDTSGTLPTVTQIALTDDSSGNLAIFGPIRRVAYFNSRLPNADLVILSGDAGPFYPYPGPSTTYSIA
jgi:hypothetical protein